MKNQWGVWVAVLSALVVILLIMNINAGKSNVALTQVFPEKNAAVGEEYVVMDDEAVPPTAPVKAVAPAAQIAPVQNISPSPMATVEKVDLSKVAYTIQVSSFKEQKYAQADLAKAQAAGLPAYLASVDLGEKGMRYRVYVGKFSAKAEADQLLPKVKGLYPGSFIIIPKK